MDTQNTLPKKYSFHLFELSEEKIRVFLKKSSHLFEQGKDNRTPFFENSSKKRNTGYFHRVLLNGIVSG